MRNISQNISIQSFVSLAQLLVHFYSTTSQELSTPSSPPPWTCMPLLLPMSLTLPTFLSKRKSLILLTLLLVPPFQVLLIPLPLTTAAPSRHAPIRTIPSDGGSMAAPSDEDGGSIAPCSHPHHHTIRRRLHDGSIASSDDDGSMTAPSHHPMTTAAPWRHAPIRRDRHGGNAMTMRAWRTRG